MNRPEVKEKNRKATIEQFRDPRKREKHREGMNRPAVRNKISVSKVGDKNPTKRPEVREKMRGPRLHMRGGRIILTGKVEVQRALIQ